MSVLIETSLGDIVIDLQVKRAPQSCINFLNLCKIKYYNFNVFHSIQKDFIAQTGDPTATSYGGVCVWNNIKGSGSKKYFVPEVHEKLSHKKKGVVSWVTSFSKEGVHFAGSQFFITLTDKPLRYMDEKYAVFGQVVEGFDVLDKLNATLVDNKSRPFRDVRIKHTIILDDPFDEIPGLSIPEMSPDPSAEMLNSIRIGEDEDITETLDPELLEKKKRYEEANARALTLEMIGDLPFADIKPPDTILFVCKLNPVTTDEDLDLIFSRFGTILSCEIVRDRKTGQSLQYAFIEFEKREDCEQAYFKMDNVLIDDRRIRVDFSQSVSKIHSNYMAGDSKALTGTILKQSVNYRQSKDESYDLVFEHGGELKNESKGKSERNFSPVGSRNRSNGNDDLRYNSSRRKSADKNSDRQKHSRELTKSRDRSPRRVYGDEDIPTLKSSDRERVYKRRDDCDRSHYNDHRGRHH